MEDRLSAVCAGRALPHKDVLVLISVRVLSHQLERYTLQNRYPAMTGVIATLMREIYIIIIIIYNTPLRWIRVP
jgi:hypothetical protein